MAYGLKASSCDPLKYPIQPCKLTGADPGYVKRGGRDPKGGGGRVADMTPK